MPSDMTTTTWECVAERDGAEEIWHVAGPGDADWRSIRCSDSEGILAPGPAVTRPPTCQACLALIAE